MANPRRVPPAAGPVTLVSLQLHVPFTSLRWWQSYFERMRINFNQVAFVPALVFPTSEQKPAEERGKQRVTGAERTYEAPSCRRRKFANSRCD